MGEPIGKQDQYIAAYGGVTCFTFHPDEGVTVEAVGHLRSTPLFNLEDNLLLFFTGFSRTPAASWPIRRRAPRARIAAMLDNLHYVKELGLQSQAGAREGRDRRRSAS